MAVSYTNNWKNITDKLISVFRNEFGSSMSVYKGVKEMAGTQSIHISPQGSTLIEQSVKSETREFNFNIFYHFSDRNLKDTAIDHIYAVVSRIEKLVHNNTSMTLADSSQAFDCNILSTELDSDEDEGIYVVKFEWKCWHMGNIA